MPPALLKRWTIKEVDLQSIARQSEQLNISPLLARILILRGCAEGETARRYLSSSLRADLPSPFEMADMEPAVRRVIDAIKNKEQIAIWGDYDVDGTTGAAVLVSFLREIGAAPIYYVPHRIEEGYGLNVEGLRRLRDRGVDLVITVDCGISNATEIQAAVKMGLSLVVVDHHQPPDQLPPAHAVINPHRKDCRFPDKDLCAAGLAFYLVIGLRARLRDEGCKLEENVSTLKVGIAGAGGIAHQHARGWRDNAPRGELVALADISPERAQIISDEYTGGKAKVYATLDEMIADPDVEAIDICLPHDLHAEAIIKAAKAGKIILCEKPLCTTQADAARIGATLKETGATFMMAHNNLFQPSLLEARKLLQLNTIGKTFVIRSIECFQNSGALLGMQGKHNLAPGESPWAWRNDPKRMGGGEVLDTGWHGDLSPAGAGRRAPGRSERGDGSLPDPGAHVGGHRHPDGHL